MPYLDEDFNNVRAWKITFLESTYKAVNKTRVSVRDTLYGGGGGGGGSFRKSAVRISKLFKKLRKECQILFYVIFYMDGDLNI